MVKATEDSDKIDPIFAEFRWTILEPIVDAGPNQFVKIMNKFS